RVERLVAPGRLADHGVHDDLVAVGVHARRVTAEDHRQLVGGQAHAAQRPQVVVVEGAGTYVDHDPVVGRRYGFVELAELQPGQRVVGTDPGGVSGSHSRTLSPGLGRAAGSGRTAER